LGWNHYQKNANYRWSESIGNNVLLTDFLRQHIRQYTARR